MNRSDYEEASARSEQWQDQFTLGGDLQWHRRDERETDQPKADDD